MNDEELGSWQTKAEAARTLHISVRALERRIAAGEIETQRRSAHAPGARATLVCNPRDIERLQPPAFTMPAAASNSALVPTNERIAAPPTLDVLAAAVATIAAVQRSSGSTTPPKRWLTVQEASAETGLSERLLRKAIKSGDLWALRDGRQWKIDRQLFNNWQPGYPAVRA